MDQTLPPYTKKSCLRGVDMDIDQLSPELKDTARHGNRLSLKTSSYAQVSHQHKEIGLSDFMTALLFKLIQSSIVVAISKKTNIVI